MIHLLLGSDARSHSTLQHCALCTPPTLAQPARSKMQSRSGYGDVIEHRKWQGVAASNGGRLDNTNATPIA